MRMDAPIKHRCLAAGETARDPLRSCNRRETKSEWEQVCQWDTDCLPPPPAAPPRTAFIGQTCRWHGYTVSNMGSRTHMKALKPYTDCESGDTHHPNSPSFIQPRPPHHCQRHTCPRRSSDWYVSPYLHSMTPETGNNFKSSSLWFSLTESVLEGRPLMPSSRPKKIIERVLTQPHAVFPRVYTAWIITEVLTRCSLLGCSSNITSEPSGDPVWKTGLDSMHTVRSPHRLFTLWCVAKSELFIYADTHTHTHTVSTPASSISVTLA